MKIKVRAFAAFREILGEDFVLDIHEGTTLSSVLDLIGSRSDDARRTLFDQKGSLKGHVIVMVNRTRQNRSELESRILSDGDEVAIYPPVAGG